MKKHKSRGISFLIATVYGALSFNNAAGAENGPSNLSDLNDLIFTDIGPSPDEKSLFREGTSVASLRSEISNLDIKYSSIPNDHEFLQVIIDKEHIKGSFKSNSCEIWINGLGQEDSGTYTYEKGSNRTGNLNTIPIKTLMNSIKSDIKEGKVSNNTRELTMKVLENSTYCHPEKSAVVSQYLKQGKPFSII